jgi:hypothetical protein
MKRSLKIGDSLSRSIDQGLAKSKHGVVILSPHFFEKNWPEYELRGLVGKSLGNARTILPLWHNIGRDDVLKFSPSLADVRAESTSQSLDAIAFKIVAAIRPDLHRAALRKLASLSAKANWKTETIPL